MWKKSIRTILLIDDNPEDPRLLREMLNEPGSDNVELTHVASMSEAEKHLAEHAVDIILLDLELSGEQGLGAIRRARAAAPSVPLVVLTALDDESLVTPALQEGAQDYLIKGQIETPGLQRAIRNAIERKIIEEALFVEKERAQVTLNSIGDAVACTDISGNITYLNPVAETMTGWSWQEAAGRPMAEVLRLQDSATREPIPDPMQMAVMGNRAVNLPSNCVLIRHDGFVIPIEDCVAPIHDREGRAAGAVIIFRDVTKARAMALHVSHLAQHDFLTDLPNRVLLNDRLGQAIALATRHTKQFALLFLDLDGFKHINDSLGHPVGDRLLQSVAKRLVDCIRGSDTVSREGGDEFIVLLSEIAHAEDAAIAARRMLQSVAQPHSISPHELHVTASIGVSIYPDDGLDAETLIKNADTAMYQAKENGRQSYQFFKPIMNVRAVERQSIEESLRRAVERQEFALHYQPKINLSTGAITGSAGGVYCGRGRLRPHSVDRCLGPSRGVPAIPGLGGCGPASDDHGRKRLAGGVSRRKLFGTSVRNPQRNGHGSEISRTGADRGRSYEVSQLHGIHTPRREGKRSNAGGRRFRHGLLQLELS